MLSLKPLKPKKAYVVFFFNTFHTQKAYLFPETS